MSFACVCTCVVASLDRLMFYIDLDYRGLSIGICELQLVATDGEGRDGEG